jgi:hypothetical protein
MDAAGVGTTGRVSAADRATITDAITKDLDDATEQAANDRERLARVEALTRVLADAVIAIAAAVAPVVKAVKAEARDTAAPAVAQTRGTYFKDERTINPTKQSTPSVRCRG